jgi:hypothetical protein
VSDDVQARAQLHVAAAWIGDGKSVETAFRPDLPAGFPWALVSSDEDKTAPAVVRIDAADAAHPALVQALAQGRVVQLAKDARP